MGDTDTKVLDTSILGTKILGLDTGTGIDANDTE